MTDLTFHVGDPPRTLSPDNVHVALYDGPSMSGFPRVGSSAKEAVRRLGLPVDARCFDLLTVALAVVAADTFVRRDLQSEVGWGRTLRLIIPLANPAAWDEVTPVLGQALGFLTGDRWSFELRDGGVPPPSPMTRRSSLVQVEKADLVCLFSGGLDSTIGVLDLKAAGHVPLLVSHAYTGDSGKQQDIQADAFPELPRLAMLANPSWPLLKTLDKKGFDITMRGRSFGFLGMAAIAASVLAPFLQERARLVVPENGFIAINAPLTRRRLGSLSTRTTHPHFLSMMQEVFDRLGVPAIIDNPYEHKTKGEMIRECAAPGPLATLAATTVSCGKWKRARVQCGRCVPCLVRRASFHAAEVDENPTQPYTYGEPPDILASKDRGDLLALGTAARWSPEDLAQAVGASGPLPPDPVERGRYEDVVRRGLIEVRAYLADANVAV